MIKNPAVKQGTFEIPDQLKQNPARGNKNTIRIID